MATFKDFQPIKNDDFFTKDREWKNISKLIPEDKKVYMPFYSPYSKCNELLGQYISNEIVYEDKDFFSYKITDGIVVDNPPFSNKKDILKKLVEDDTPFMLLLPVSSMCYKYFRNTFEKKNELQFVIMENRPSFIKCNSNGDLTDDNKSSAFDCIWFCYKMNLENDITFL